MAIENNNPTEEEVVEQPEGLPPEVMVEGEEEALKDLKMILMLT
ncbi:MAG: hypothetical protein CM15mV124_110 [uncultured marine virus]|nr:MAG: hypothetical protein CM15mV124_110 [uncultured marine virus]